MWSNSKKRKTLPAVLVCLSAAHLLAQEAPLSPGSVNIICAPRSMASCATLHDTPLLLPAPNHAVLLCVNHVTIRPRSAVKSRRSPKSKA